MVLDQDHSMIRDAVRTFVRSAIAPNAAAWDRERSFPKDVHRQLAELGAYGVLVPAEYGGAGLDALALGLARVRRGLLLVDDLLRRGAAAPRPSSPHERCWFPDATKHFRIEVDQPFFFLPPRPSPLAPAHTPMPRR